MGEQISVQVSGINEFAGTSERRGGRFDAVIAELEAARVGRESFGKMPASGDIFGMYEQRVAAAMDDLRECAEGMRDISESMRDTAADYQGVDAGGAQAMKDVMGNLEGISVPEVGR